MPTRRNLTPARVLLVALALSATACQLRLDVSVDVNRQGGGTLGVTLGADQELLDAAAEADVDPLGNLAQTGRSLRDDRWQVSQGSADGFRTVTLRREFADPDEFNAIAAQLAAALAADEVVLLEPFTLTLAEDQIAVAGTAGAQPRRAVRDYGLTRRSAVELVKAEEALDYTVSVTLPGETLSTTTTDAGVTPLVWQVPVGETVVVAAQSTRPGPPVLRAVVGALGGAVAAGALLWLWSRRRSRRS